MAKIDRKLQKLFGSTGTATGFAKFGSLAAGSPILSKDIDTIQSGPEYLSGWVSALLGASNPAIEDANALAYLFSYQIAYQFQAGVPEWNEDTEYHTGSIVNYNGGKLYICMTDDLVDTVNPQAAVVDPTNTDWRFFNLSSKTETIVFADSPYDALLDDSKLNVDASSGIVVISLPDPTTSEDETIIIRKTEDANHVQVTQDDGSDTEVCKLHSAKEKVTLVCDGTDWVVEDRFIDSTWYSWTPVHKWDSYGTQVGFQRRVGQHMEFKFSQTLDSTPTGGDAVFEMDIPTGFTPVSFDYDLLGHAHFRESSGLGWDGTVTTTNLGGIEKIWIHSSATGGRINTSKPFSWGNDDDLRVHFSMQIVDWEA